MASILTKVGTATNVPVQTFNADTVRDMWDIKTKGVPMGSRCYVIDNGSGTGAWYVLSSNGNWYAEPSGSGSILPSGSEVTYDGGSVDTN